MKSRMILAAAALCGAMFLAGCGNNVDENKTPAQIQSEAAKMSVEDIQKVVAEYQKAIEKKASEIAKETDKLAKIPLAEQLGDDAKAIRAEIAKLTESMNKLKANAEAYLQEIKAKQK